MKKSQEYPKRFGKAIARLHLNFMATSEAPVQPLPEVANMMPSDWSCAELDDLKAFLKAEYEAKRFVPLKDAPWPC